MEEYNINDYDNENRIGIPIQTSNTFYSDFIGQYCKYINITDDNDIIFFRNIIKHNNKIFINTIYGDLYMGCN